MLEDSPPKSKSPAAVSCCPARYLDLPGRSLAQSTVSQVEQAELQRSEAIISRLEEVQGATLSSLNCKINFSIIIKKRLCSVVSHCGCVLLFVKWHGMKSQLVGLH